MKDKKLVVVWISSFSNSTIRERLKTNAGWHNRLLWRITKRQGPLVDADRGIWTTNAIREFEKFDNVELHIISPVLYLSERTQVFEINGVFYHFYRDEVGQFINSIYIKLAKPKRYQFSQNRHVVKKMIKGINPDIIHMMGAENPSYSITLLDVPESIPTILQLQTLMNDPEFKENYPLSESMYTLRSDVERRVILKANYLGTRAQKYHDIIVKTIKPNARFVNTGLALAEEVNIENNEKQFDFVYFASDLAKAGDLALEAFGLAYQQDHSITIDIVGGCTKSYKAQLDTIIAKYNAIKAVSFEGHLETHDDVIKQIKKARFALLPLRIDITSGTIREAMSCGLPVVTTDTGELGTQNLNSEEICALISPKEDVQSLALNMLRLIDEPNLAEILRTNAIKSQVSKYSNIRIANEYLDAYNECIRESRFCHD